MPGAVPGLRQRKGLVQIVHVDGVFLVPVPTFFGLISRDAAFAALHGGVFASEVANLFQVHTELAEHRLVARPIGVVREWLCQVDFSLFFLMHNKSQLL